VVSLIFLNFRFEKIKSKHDVCHILKVTFVTCDTISQRIQWSYQIKACGLIDYSLPHAILHERKGYYEHV